MRRVWRRAAGGSAARRGGGRSAGRGALRAAAALLGLMDLAGAGGLTALLGPAGLSGTTGLNVTAPYVFAAGPTPVGGPIEGDVTWSPADSPYIVTRDITVYPDAGLTVEAGTVVQFEYVDNPKPYTRRAVLEVRGDLYVRGAPGEPVRFGVAGDNPEIGAWGGIWINGESARAEISFAEISHAVRGVYASNARVTVRDSIIHRCWTGIHLDGARSGTTIERNSISGNEEGVYARRSQAVVSWNILADNVWGIYSSQNERLQVTHNDIKSNQYGVLIDGRGGVEITQNDFSVRNANDYAVMVRRGTPAKLEQNNFHFREELADTYSIFWMLYIQGTEDVVAPDNWWGTLPDESTASAEAFIETYTFDRRDAYGVGRLEYKPFAREPVEGTIDDLRPPDVRVLESPVFSPDGDGRVDRAQIVYTLSESAAWVRVEVIDEAGLAGQGNGAVLWSKEWRAADPSTGETDPPEVRDGRHIVWWDGTWEEGDSKRAPGTLPETEDGRPYVIRITAQDRDHPDDPRMQGEGEAQLYVDRTPPDLDITRPRPTGDGSGIVVHRALVEVEGTVSDETATGLVVEVQGKQATLEPGSGRFHFTGRAWLTATGESAVTVRATDGAGNRESHSLTLHHDPPLALDVDSPTNQAEVVVTGWIFSEFSDRVADVRVRAAAGEPTEADLSGALWEAAALDPPGDSSRYTFTSVSPLALQRGMNTVQAQALDSSGEPLGGAVALVEMDPYADRTREAHFLAGLSMITVPMEGSSDHRAVLGLPGLKLSRWQWDPETGTSGYVVYGEEGLEPFAPGRGFWLELDEPYGHEVTGDLVDPTVELYPVQLQKGWNQIGNPFLDAVSWDDLTLRLPGGHRSVPVGQAVSNGWIANTAWGYWSAAYRPVGSGGGLHPWAGYWLKAYREAELLVPGPGEGSPSEVGSVQPAAVSTRSIDSTDDGWSFHLEVWAAADRSQGRPVPHAVIRLGARGEASPSFDPLYDAEEPPPVEGSPRIAVVHGDWGIYSGRYVVDIQGAAHPLDGALQSRLRTSLRAQGWGGPAPFSSGTGWTWEVSLSGGERLRWPDVDRVPEFISLFLVDPGADAPLNLREANGYGLSSSDGERSVRIVALAGDVPLELSHIRVYPNPTSLENGVTIEYTLSRPARVRVRIDDAIGRPVLWPEEPKSMPAGRHTFQWDGRSSGGRLVANGLYVVTVSAIDASGGRTRAVAKLGVLK